MTPDLTRLPDALNETLAWQVLAEIVRRHPGRLWIETATHSIGTEQAYIVEVGTDHTRAVGYFGLPGANATAMVTPGGPDNWRDFYRADDPHDWLLAYEHALGLTPPTGGLPASTPRSLAVRWTAAFLRAKIGGRERWIAGGEHRWPTISRTWHGLVPTNVHWVGSNFETGRLGPLFLGVEHGEPEFALTPDGDLFTTDGAVGNLTDFHRSGNSITQLLAHTVPQHLP